MRYFVRLAYNGTPFHGWQRQPNASSVQQILEEALSLTLRSDIGITGAGRTDTGVNARTMWAHFDADITPDAAGQLTRSLNSIVGRDIAVYEVRPVIAEAHARFDALSRTYKYFISARKSPFAYPFSLRATSNLDYDAMNKAAAILLQTEDFTSFAKLHSDAKTNICNVMHARWEHVGNQGDEFMVFTITADRFLRNMVRAVVGTLVDVGRGKLSVEGFRDVIDSRNRCAAGTSMPPQALFLWDIAYNPDIFIPSDI